VVEVGVYKCMNAARVLAQCAQQLSGYHLVDPWCPYGIVEAEGELDAGCPLNVDWESLYQQALWLKTQYPVVQVWRLPSVEAAKQFEEESLDFVFIDGDHSYTAVKADIIAWLPRVRTGGILAGHDYYQRWPGVVRAVDELLGARELRFLPDVVWYVET